MRDIDTDGWVCDGSRLTRDTGFVAHSNATSGFTETLNFEMPVLEAEKISLLEGPLEIERDEPSVTHGGQRVRIPLGPCEIATVVIAFDSPAPKEQP